MNPIDTQTLTRDFGKRFIESHYPDELPYFELFWQEFLAAPEGSERRSESSGVGLPFFSEKELPARTPFAFVFADFAFREFAIRGFAPAPDKLRDLVKYAGKLGGAPKDLIDEVVEQAPAAFLRYCRKMAESIPEMSIVPPIAADSFFVEQLLSGKYIPTKPAKRGEIRTLIASRRFDLVIDEPEDRITIRWGRSVRRKPVLTPRTMERGTLWLALTRVGSGVTKQDIDVLFGPTTGERDYFQYRHFLGELVGHNLRDRIMPKRRGGVYKIPSADWSFCWIRSCANPQGSLLRHELPKSVTK